MRPRRDIDDMDDSFFDREEAQRLRQERTAMVQNGIEREAANNAADKATASRVRAANLKANDDFLLREYQNAGVAPPMVTATGVPAVSLALLLRIGWTIEEVAGDRRLVKPPPPEKYVARGECS